MSSASNGEGTHRVAVKKKLAKKKDKPDFKRQESWRYVKLSHSWRRPKGIDNKMRLSRKGWPPTVNVGYRSPKSTRGFHPSGLQPVLVSSIKDLKEVSEREDVIVVISSRVGERLKRVLTEEARSLGLRVANPYSAAPTGGGVG
ncbi:MAG: 50S ribosomal protein L32e [Candidatus Bathyarchaeia archaeon]